MEKKQKEEADVGKTAEAKREADDKEELKRDADRKKKEEEDQKKKVTDEKQRAEARIKRHADADNELKMTEEKDDKDEKKRHEAAVAAAAAKLAPTPSQAAAGGSSTSAPPPPKETSLKTFKKTASGFHLWEDLDATTLAPPEGAMARQTDNGSTASPPDAAGDQAGQKAGSTASPTDAAGQTVSDGPVAGTTAQAGQKASTPAPPQGADTAAQKVTTMAPPEGITSEAPVEKIAKDLVTGKKDGASKQAAGVEVEGVTRVEVPGGGACDTGGEGTDGASATCGTCNLYYDSRTGFGNSATKGWCHYSPMVMRCLSVAFAEKFDYELDKECPKATKDAFAKHGAKDSVPPPLAASGPTTTASTATAAAGTSAPTTAAAAAVTVQAATTAAAAQATTAKQVAAVPVKASSASAVQIDDVAGDAPARSVKDQIASYLRPLLNLPKLILGPPLFPAR
jgi:hypothetical protein